MIGTHKINWYMIGIREQKLDLVSVWYMKVILSRKN